MTWTVNDEIKIMANVQAYFHVAHKVCTVPRHRRYRRRYMITFASQRFIDYVPLAIEHEVNQNFAKRIRNTLIDTIFKDEASERINMERLLDEDPVIAKQRADLREKISGLERIKQKLDEFWFQDSISRLGFDEEMPI